MKLYHVLTLLFAAYNIDLFLCEAPNALCRYGQEKLTFENILPLYLRYQPQYTHCRTKDAKHDTNLVHGILTLNTDLVAEAIAKRKNRSCPVPVYPIGEYAHLAGHSAQLIAAVQFELVLHNKEPEDVVTKARDIITIVSGGHAEYMNQKWNPRGYGRQRS